MSLAVRLLQVEEDLENERKRCLEEGIEYKIPTREEILMYIVECLGE